jgi:hypothetical protein
MPVGLAPSVEFNDADWVCVFHVFMSFCFTLLRVFNYTLMNCQNVTT